MHLHKLSQRVARQLIQGKKSLSIAESCTGGLICDSITNVPGSSAFFLLGIIAYDNAAKTNILRVPSSLLKKHGAVSGPVASAMARGVRQILKTDYGLAVTGIAGPSGGSKAKPVGLVFIAISTAQTTIAQKFMFKGNRVAIKKQAAHTALKMLERNNLNQV